MQKVVFAEGWREIFRENGLSCFRDFADYSDEHIRWRKKRYVVGMLLGEGKAEQRLFMKFFIRPPLKDMLSNLRNFGRLRSQAACEWENARLLLENGIETYRPVCLGEETVLGVERRSFLVTRKVRGQCMTDYVVENWRRLSGCQKKDLMAGLAQFVRAIHNAGFSLPDLYAWHVYLTRGEEGKGWDFAVIDLHRMRTKSGRNSHLENLGALDFSMPERHFDEELKSVFFRTYFGSEPAASDIRWIRKYSQKLAKRRTIHLY